MFLTGGSSFIPAVQRVFAPRFGDERLADFAAGAFIGVPILISLATVCAKRPSTRPIAVLLSADGAMHAKANQ